MYACVSTCACELRESQNEATVASLDSINEILRLPPFPYFFIRVALGTNFQIVLSSVLALESLSTLEVIATNKALLSSMPTL